MKKSFFRQTEPVRAMIAGKQEYHRYSSAPDYAEENEFVNVQAILEWLGW
jgi:hypothetical protein